MLDAPMNRPRPRLGSPSCARTAPHVALLPDRHPPFCCADRSARLGSSESVESESTRLTPMGLVAACERDGAISQATVVGDAINAAITLSALALEGTAEAAWAA